MEAFGYIANQQQTEQAMYGINMTVNLVFGIMFLCCLIPLYLYPLNEQKNQEIREKLDHRRKGE